MKSLFPSSDPAKVAGLVARSTWAKQFTEGQRVLVCGCGSGMETQYYGEDASLLIGVDYDPEAVKFAQANYPHVFMLGDIKHLPFQNHTFDVVVAFEVLEHFHYESVLQVLREVMRVLKPGGKFIGSTPKMTDHTRWLTHEKEGLHCVLYHETDLKKLLAVFPQAVIHPSPAAVSWAHLFECTTPSYDAPCNIDLVLLSCYRVGKTMQCLESLALRERNFHVWLVENGSPTAIQDTIYENTRQYPWVSMITSKRNLFCGGGRQLATSFGYRPYVAWFDNDMLIHPKCLTLLQKTLAEQPKVGAVCAQVWCGNKVQLNGRRIVNGAVDYSLDNLSKADPRVRVTFSPDIMHGGATMYRRTALEQTVHDCAYRFACDDLDTLMQLRAAGWEFRNCPKAVVSHFPDVGTGDEYSQLRRNKQAIAEDRAYFTSKWGIRL